MCEILPKGDGFCAVLWTASQKFSKGEKSCDAYGPIRRLQTHFRHIASMSWHRWTVFGLCGALVGPLTGLLVCKGGSFCAQINTPHVKGDGFCAETDIDGLVRRNTDYMKDEGDCFCAESYMAHVRNRPQMHSQRGP